MKHVLIAAAFFLVITGCVLSAVYYRDWQGWIAYESGSQNTGGAPPNYNFWSGAGSDISELAIVAGLVGLYRRHNCHTRNCLRIGRYPVAGTPFITCRKHHPHIDVVPTAQDIATMHTENCEDR